MSPPAFHVPAGARCALCGGVLAGEVARDAHGRVFCGRHRSAGRHCRSCDRFFLPAAPGAERCDTCVGTLVTDAAVANRACADAAHWFARCALPLPPAPEVRLGAAMPRSPYAAGTPMLGYAARRGAATGIVVQAGLPLVQVRMVLAHELGHVMIAGGDIRLPAWAEEGGCDWLAHRYLGSLDMPEAEVQRRRIEARADPVHGAGFRWMRARLAGRPPADLLRLLRRGGFPDRVPPT